MLLFLLEKYDYTQRAIREDDIDNRVFFWGRHCGIKFFKVMICPPPKFNSSICEYITLHILYMCSIPLTNFQEN